MALTLREAIEHAREVASSQSDVCSECRADHEQLASWLEDYASLLQSLGLAEPHIGDQLYPFQQRMLQDFFPTQDAQPSPCASCSNNPANGGSGICLCTLGLPKITC